MVKFLKFILFIVIIAFSFALGVRFSDSFKNNLGSFKNDEIKVESEMNKTFNNLDNEVRKITNNDEREVEVAPLTEEEKNDVMNQSETMPKYVDIEIIEPMDGVAPMPADSVSNSDTQQPAPMNPNAQTVQNTDSQVSTQPATVEPVQTPAQNTAVSQPVAPVESAATTDAQPANPAQPAPVAAQPAQQVPAAMPAQQGQAIKK